MPENPIKPIPPPETAPVEKDYQIAYALQVLTLISVAQDIRAGRASDLLQVIEDGLPAYLTTMVSHTDSSYRTVALHTGGQLYGPDAIKRFGPQVMASIQEAGTKLNQVLSDGCFKEIRCDGGKGCVPWPTSLRAVDVNTPDPMGWKFIVGSHCGFSWPKFWNLDCGPPVALVACTGSG